MEKRKQGSGRFDPSILPYMSCVEFFTSGKATPSSNEEDDRFYIIIPRKSEDE